MNTKLRAQLIDRLGGKCERCGYSHCARALHFHHHDASEKAEWSRGTGRASLQEVAAHPERFMLTCANCHAELHDEESRASATIHACRRCGKPFRSQPSRRAATRGYYCSHKCADADRSALAATAEWIEARIMRHVEVIGSCWEWQAYMLRDMTPVMAVANGDGTHVYRPVPRVIYELRHGKIAGRNQVVRTCKNRRCVNPDHLLLRVKQG